MALKLKGSTSGFVAIDAPSVAGNNTLILPENTGSAHQILANDITAGVTTFTQITVSRNGDLTVPGTISIGGTLTYEDVTSVDSVGIVTARGLSIFGNTTGLSVTGVGTFAGDVSIADKIIHTGDTNTAIRFPAADTITAETGGSERLRINSSGIKVSGSFPDIIIHDTSTTNDNFRILHNSGGTQLQVDPNNVGPSDSYLIASIDGTERARIDSSGRLLIGGTSISSASSYYDDLVISNTTSGTGSGLTLIANATNGYSAIDFADTAAGGRGRITYSHGDDDLRIDVGGSERIRIISTGEVSMGGFTATAGDGVLQLNGGLRIAGSASASDTTSPYIYRTSGHDHLNFATSGVERLRITSAGDVLIYTGDLTVTRSGLAVNTFDSTDNHSRLRIKSGNSSLAQLEFGDQTDVDAGEIRYDHNDERMTFHVGSNTERMRIDQTGALTFTANNNGQIIHSFRNDNTTAGSYAMTSELWFRFNRSGGGMNASAARIIAGKEREWIGGASNQDGYLAFHTLANEVSYERMRMTASGNIGIGLAAAEEKLHVSGNGRFNDGILINTNAHHNSSKFHLKGHSTGSHTAMRVTNSSGGEVMILRCDGYFAVSGSVNGNTKNFSIPHPIESLSSTKKLVHASIESPQLDLIYRGKVDLVGGTATVNIDSVSNMTDGTFVVLNRNIQCFTTNETGWGAVKGSVSGNILTITAQDNSSTDTISWMVIGERQDPNIITSTITDDDGYLIVEPEKVDES